VYGSEIWVECVVTNDGAVMFIFVYNLLISLSFFSYLPRVLKLFLSALRGDKVVPLAFAEGIKWLSGGRLDVAAAG
jgi:hypothetical protein